MDANYFIDRLKSTLNRYQTAAVLRNRLDNLDDFTRQQIVKELKKEVLKERNHDIKQALVELLFRMPIAS